MQSAGEKRQESSRISSTGQCSFWTRQRFLPWFAERGHDKGAAVPDGASASAVNLAEVLTRFVRDGHSIAAVLQQLEIYKIEWVPFDYIQAAEVAALWPQTRQAGLALADRACLALALERNLPVLTADPVWAELGLPLDIRLIR